MLLNLIYAVRCYLTGILLIFFFPLSALIIARGDVCVLLCSHLQHLLDMRSTHGPQRLSLLLVVLGLRKVKLPEELTPAQAAQELLPHIPMSPFQGLTIPKRPQPLFLRLPWHLAFSSPSSTTQHMTNP